MSAPTIDMKNLLLLAPALGTFGTNPNINAYSIFIGREPATPDKTVTLYDTAGEAPNPKWLLDYPRFQVRVRGKQYEDAYNQCEAVKSRLLGLPSQDLGGIRYDGIYVVIDTTFLMTDENQRFIFTASYRIIREPTVGQHRRPL